MTAQELQEIEYRVHVVVVVVAVVVVINPRRACAARVTVVVVSVCLSVCVCVCLLSHIITFGASVRPENAVTYSVGNKGQKICGVFSDTASFQSYGTCCIVRPPCSRPFFSPRNTRVRF